MKHEKLAIVAAMMVASLVVAPVAHAKKKNAFAPAPAVSTPAANPQSQAGGLPATNDRVDALEAAVGTLQVQVGTLQSQVGELQTQLAAEVQARMAADAALSAQLGAIPKVFVGEGSMNDISGATATVASKTVPAGTYFIAVALQLVNAQSSGDANARCVVYANGDMVADTSDLEFPILATDGSALGSTMFAPLQGSYTSSSEINVTVQCTESKGDNGGLNAYAQIAALKAGTLE
jgi:hypothetical protein